MYVLQYISVHIIKIYLQNLCLLYFFVKESTEDLDAFGIMTKHTLNLSTLLFLQSLGGKL